MSETTPFENIYTLIDDENNEQTFELIDVLELEDERYFALIPYYGENAEDAVEDDGSLVILKSEIVDGEEMMATIDSDEEYDRIGEIFMQRLEEMFDEEEEELDEE